MLRDHSSQVSSASRASSLHSVSEKRPTVELENATFERYLRVLLKDVGQQLCEAHALEMKRMMCTNGEERPRAQSFSDPVDDHMKQKQRVVELGGDVDETILDPCFGAEDPCFEAEDEECTSRSSEEVPKFWLQSESMRTRKGTIRSSSMYSSLSAMQHLNRRFEKFIDGAGFETVFGILILLNTLTMSIEAQARGWDAGFELGFINAGSEHPHAYEAMKLYLDILETCFGTFFTIEVTLKFCAQKLHFFRSAWNYFDTAVIGFWMVDQMSRSALVINPMILRLCRLARLLRLLRLVKMIQLFDSLHMLIGAIKASCSVLLWAVVLLLVTMVVCALCVNQVLQSYMMSASNPDEYRKLIFSYWGSTTRAVTTMFEITLANWAPPTRALVDHVNEWFGLGVLIYRVLVGFAVINVISGVFMHETFKVANSNDDLMIIQKERTTQQHVRKMTKQFSQADENSDGLISKEEFLHLYDDRRVVQWLSAMELHSRDGSALFELLSDGKPTITAEELVINAAALKGGAKSIDMATLINLTGTLRKAVKDISRKVDDHYR